MRKTTLLIAALALLGQTAVAALNDAEIRDCYHRSYRYEQTQAYRDAIKALLRVQDAFARGYTVNLRLGWLYYLSANHANSLHHYEIAIQAAPSSLEAKLGYILPLMAQDRMKEAEEVARQILRIDPANYLGNLRLVQALRLQRKLDQAEPIVNGMLLLYPTDIKFLTELGLLKAARKDKDAARRLFNDVLILDPENLVAKQQMDKL